MDSKYKDPYKEPYKPVDLPQVDKDNYVQIHCPKCSCVIPSDDLDLKDKLAKCDSCDIVFSFTKSVANLSAEQGIMITEEISRPAGVELLVLENELEFTLSQPQSVLYIILASVMPMILIISIGMTFAEGVVGAAVPLVFSLFMMIFSIVKLIKHKKDKIYLTIDEYDIHVEHRPKNLITDKSFPKDRVEQLYVKKLNNLYHLQAIINGPNGQIHKKIVGNFRNIFHAKFLEQEIENYLDITDKKIPGAV